MKSNKGFSYQPPRNKKKVTLSFPMSNYTLPIARLWMNKLLSDAGGDPQTIREDRLNSKRRRSAWVFTFTFEGGAVAFREYIRVKRAEEQAAKEAQLAEPIVDGD